MSQPLADIPTAAATVSTSSGAFTCLAVLTITLLILQWYHSQKQACKNASSSVLPPGSTGWPLIGETIEFLMDGKKFFQLRLEKYGPIFRSSLIGKPFVIISGSKYVRTILMASEDTIILESPDSIRRLFGDKGFYSMNGAAHLRLQRYVRGLFNQRTLAMFTAPMQAMTQDYISRWCKLGRVLGKQETRHLTFALCNQLLLGLELDDDDFRKVVAIFDDYNKAFIAFPINIPGFAFYKGMKAREAILELIRKKTISSNSDGISLLDKIMQQNSNTSSENGTREECNLVGEEVLDITLELLYASQETLSSALCTILIQLATHNQVLEDIRQELKDHGIGQDDELSFHAIQSLTFVNDVMKEVLRLVPPIAGVFRKTVKPLEIGGYTVPVGWRILFGISGTHDLCTAFDDVNAFDPYRWKRLAISSDENALEKHDYIPFSIGKRFCVGQEFAKHFLRVFLIEVARHCSWNLVNGVPAINTCPVPFPKDNLPLQVYPHEHLLNKRRHECLANEE